MLCFRCEHRARSLEGAKNGLPYHPRMECGQHADSKCGCYMFMPCLPVVTRPVKGDNRPRCAGSLISCREDSVRVLEPEEDGLALKPVLEDGQDVALAWGVSNGRSVR